MIRFRQYLKEIFDNGNIYPYKLNSSSSGENEYEFKTNNDIIYVSILTDGEIFAIAFFSRNNGHELTRSNDTRETLKIYNTVIDICKYDLRRRFRRGNAIVFNSHDPRTFNIYKRFGNMLAKMVNGKLEIDESKKRVFIFT